MDNELKSRGFTLAEALITLVIIGVIAALTIPAILVNTEQHEYKSALKKALSALNQVIELNVALEGYGPIEVESGGSITTMETNEDSLYNFFRKRMNVISTSNAYNWGNTTNMAFFTADGMRFEFPTTPSISGGVTKPFQTQNSKCARYDLVTPVQDDAGQNMNAPCLVIVDVNGQRKPNPQKKTGSYKVPSATGRSKVLDVYPIIVTDVAAYPFGVVGQRALFQHD